MSCDNCKKADCCQGRNCPDADKFGAVDALLLTLTVLCIASLILQIVEVFE